MLHINYFRRNIFFMIKLQAIWKIAKKKKKTQICHTIGENLVNFTENEMIQTISGNVIADQHRIYLLNETVKQSI